MYHLSYFGVWFRQGFPGVVHCLMFWFLFLLLLLLLVVLYHNYLLFYGFVNFGLFEFGWSEYIGVCALAVI